MKTLKYCQRIKELIIRFMEYSNSMREMQNYLEKNIISQTKMLRHLFIIRINHLIMKVKLKDLNIQKHLCTEDSKIEAMLKV